MDEDNANVNFDTIESHLMRFGGGSISLSKEHYDKSIAILYLSHPEKRNAISGKMMVDFRRCVNELETWTEGKCVLLCGLGTNFCSGGDLDFARATGTPKEGYYMSYMMQDILKRYRKLPLVSVSLVHGPALGGGAEIAIFSDYILVADTAKLGFVEGKMGVLTAFGGTTRLIQILGERKAMEILLLSKIYNAEECIMMGLANKVVATESRMEEAIHFICQFTVHHSSILQRFKKVITNCSEETFERNLVYERDLFCPTWGSEVNREALDKHIKHINK